MTGPLLRSGTLTAFHPLGAVGNPVYLAAAQLRAAIGRRLGPELADSFAIPQRNEDGDTIDWYAPKPGTVVPWSAASSDERAEAQRQLIEARSRIEELGGAMQRESDAERQVFGRLLAHVTSFPDETHIYLVDGRPVITFWGFVLDRASVGTDPLLNLDLLAAPAAASAQPSRWRIPWWAWVLALLALALLGGLLALRACQPVSDATAPGEPASALPAETTAAETPPEDEVRHLVDPDQEERPAIEELQDRPQGTERVVISPRDVVPVERRTGVTDVDASGVGRVPDVEGAAVPTGADAVEPATGEVDAVADGEAASGAGEVEADSSIAEPVGEAAVDTAADVPAAEGEVPVQPVDPADAAAPGSDEPVPDGPVSDEVPAESEPVTEPVTEAGSDGSAEDAVQPPVVPTEEAEQATPGAEARSDEAAESKPQTEVSADKVEADRSGDAQSDTEKAAPAGAEGTDPAADAARGATDASRVDAAAAGSSAAGAAPPTRWLSTGWRSATSLQDPKTGLPIQMDYQLKDGAGKVRLKRHDGSVCEGGASAQVRDGKLVIDSGGNIVCADGTNFGRPKVECEPGKDGKARCRGSYPGGESFSIDMKEQGR